MQVATYKTRGTNYVCAFVDVLKERKLFNALDDSLCKWTPLLVFHRSPRRVKPVPYLVGCGGALLEPVLFVIGILLKAIDPECF
jgi:hypothetical protein